jgi:hypothetical protein
MIMIYLAFFTSNNAFSMLGLRRQYASVENDTERTMFLAAGHTMVSLYTGTAYIVFTTLGSIAPIIISIVALRHGVFTKVTGWTGVIGNLLPFGLFVSEVGKYVGLTPRPFFAFFDHPQNAQSDRVFN